MVSLSITQTTKTSQKKPDCKCGWPGEVKIGRRWYCKYCLDYGDDEDATMDFITRLRIRLRGIKLC